MASLAMMRLRIPHIYRQCYASRLLSSSTASSPTTSIPDRLGPVLQAYEDFVGLTEVKEAQNNVIQAEKKFLAIQEKRRLIQQDMSVIQSRLKSISTELDKTNRGDDRYLDLVKTEHSIIREEYEMIENLKGTEKSERESFALLSAAVRESHEKERARAERTKYWSIIGSVIGAVIGIAGTTTNNYLRMKELRGIVSESVEKGDEFKNTAVQLVEVVGSQYKKMDSFIGDLKTALGSDAKTLKLENVNIPAINNLNELTEHTEQILNSVKKQETILDAEMKDIKKLLGIEKSTISDQNIVYVGPEIESMLKRTEDNLEWKIKLNSLATATVIYGALALTIPVLLSIFNGGS
ncbi:mitochondrial potassium channel [Patella vulgata]|uniref:mitochondrial potassium channel n=1 Tax=Patella vulgata TaxID=6465 RepID=UPI00217FDC92|nr:mitochondrial potassium channel [Patella vulgata]